MKINFRISYSGSIASRLAICMLSRLKENIGKGAMQCIASFNLIYNVSQSETLADMASKLAICMEIKMDYEQILMIILVNGGAARANALKAIRSARKGNIVEAGELMKLAEESLAKAHESQTELIQAEARGEKTEVTLLTVHTQDHLMNAMTVRDLAEEIIEEIKLIQELEEKLKQ